MPVLIWAPGPHFSLLARDFHTHTSQTQCVQTGLNHPVKFVSLSPTLEEKPRSHPQLSPLSQPPNLVTMSYTFLHISTITVASYLNCSKSQQMAPGIQSLSLLTVYLIHSFQSNPSKYSSYGITPLQNETQYLNMLSKPPQNSPVPHCTCSSILQYDNTGHSNHQRTTLPLFVAIPSARNVLYLPSPLHH